MLSSYLSHPASCLFVDTSFVTDKVILALICVPSPHTVSVACLDCVGEWKLSDYRCINQMPKKLRFKLACVE